MIYVLVVVSYCLYGYVYKVSRLTIAPSLQSTVVLAVLSGATGAENDVTTVAPHCFFWVRVSDEKLCGHCK